MIYAIAAVLVLVLDQAVKFWTTRNIPLDAIGEDCVELIPDVLHMTNVHNTGAAFSILENARWLLIAVSVIFVIGIIFLISQEIIHTRFGKWTSVLVMAGALGNCIDRVLYGFVVDMFEVELFTFAVFNVADIFITVCGILFCIHVIVYKDPTAVPAGNKRRKAEYEEAEAAPRRARKEKDDPYAAIPHRDRSAHRSLDEELKPADPDDPFGEWNFGDVVEQPAPRRVRRTTSVEEEPAPRRVRRTESAEEDPTPRRVRRTEFAEDDWSAAMDLDKIAASRKQASASRPAPKKTPTPSVDASDVKAPKAKAHMVEEESYTLEDILSEFRDIDF